MVRVITVKKQNKQYIMVFSCIDVETTGLNKSIDRIVQLAIVNFDEKFKILQEKSWFIKPTGNWKMNPDAEAVHNISEDYIKEHGVSLKSIISEFLEMLGENPILTYNGSSFDISFIQRDFEREGLETGFDKHEFIDAFDIERRVNSNRLGDAYRRYYGEDFEDAHDALADVKATIKVYQAQCKKHKDLVDEETGENLINESKKQITEMMQTSPEGFVYLDKEGVLKFRVGKFKEYPVNQVCNENPSYIKWLFTPNNGDNIITAITKKSIKASYYDQKQNVLVD